MTTNPPKLRLYQGLWEKIKLDNKTTITAPICFHKRIIKAVIKEKYKDDGYRLMQLESKQVKKLLYKTDGNRIKFWLVNMKITIAEL